MVTTQDNTNNQVDVNDDQLDAFFAQGLERHQAEDWQAAENFYRKVLAVMPKQPNVNYNLGMLKMQLNQSNASLDFFKAALSADESEPKYWLGYVDALSQAGQKKQAVDILMQGIEGGLHGEEVNALVERLTKLAVPAATVMPATVVNYATQSNAIAIPQATVKTLAQVPSEKPSKKTVAKPKKPKGINHYLDNPQIKKMLALKEAGKFKQAKKQGTGLLRFFPNNPVILTCLGMIAVEQGDYDGGVKQLVQSLTIVPEQTTVLSYLSIAYTKLKKLTDAVHYADKAIAINPEFAEAHANRGNALQALKRYGEAVDSYKKAVSLKPEDVSVRFDLGETLVALTQYEEAAIYLQEGLLLNPKDIAAQQACGNALFALTRYEQALNCYNVIIKMQHSNIDALEGRGLTYIEVKEFESARADFARIIQLNPDHTNSHLRLGVALRSLGRYEEAFTENEITIAQDKNYVQAYNNQALLLVDMKRFDEALDCYHKAIEIAPQHQETYWNKSLLHLLLGDYKQGWALYESRWKSIFKDVCRHFPQPMWLGNESLAGKTILIYAEQGFGDDIQFCRYVAEVEKLGAKVILDVHKPVVSLMAGLKGNFTIIESKSDLPDFDYHCSMMSLPYVFKTQLETIPANTPYIYASESKAQDWQKKLGKKTQPRVGLVWSGSMRHKNDHHRSLSLETLRPLFSLPVEFHALQAEIRPDDKSTLAEFDGIHIHQASLKDFSDTAALIENMDLVITVDTSVAHLAGAMGKDCWVLLPHSPDFRWLLDRNDSPWYPSITLFRQTECNQWQDVIDAISRSLQEKVI